MKNLNESPAVRTLNTMYSLVPSIRTFAILTAENRMNREDTPQQNKKANKELEFHLKNMVLGFRKLKGFYDREENSYFVPNITKNEALNLGEKFEQETIIFADHEEKEIKGKPYKGFVFKMITSSGPDKGKIVAERQIFVNMDGKTNYYSEVKGRKFQIPFFEDDTIDNIFNPDTYMIESSSINEENLKEINRLLDESMDDGKILFGRALKRYALRQKIASLKKF